jgi:hypothetical protein
MICSNKAFLGEAPSAAAPTNWTVGAAGDTSRPYKCVDF